MDFNLQNEPKTIGLSSGAHALLKRLVEDRHFNEMIDAYRFGVALALACEAEPPEVVNRTTIFNFATVDPQGEIATVVRAISRLEGIPTYRQVERYAEWGVTELSRLSEKGEIDFPSLLEKVRNLSAE